MNDGTVYDKYRKKSSTLHNGTEQWKERQLKELVIPYYISLISDKLTDNQMVLKVKQASQNFELK